MKQTYLFKGRIIAWFSCGAASAVSTKLAIDKYGDECYPVYCNTLREEHPDNVRFIQDCERWWGRCLTIISSSKYTSPSEVFEKERYIVGINGARCTAELKRIPRFKFQNPEDVHIFGFTKDEQRRILEFEDRNREMFLEWILKDKNITKQDCYKIIMQAGIKLPKIYRMGYPHNNCLGCVKSSSPGYWNKIRRDFPEIFAKRAKISRELNVRLVKYNGARIFLDELDPKAKGRWKDEQISCGPECGLNGKNFFA